jgi:SNF2 family DNA or RNA helicase
MALELRPYQKEDAQFLSTLNTGACFNEQRTGKTPTILETCRLKQCSKIIIVCPKSAIPQWTAEYEKWLKKPCVAIIGTKAQKEKAVQNWTHGLVISYDSLKRTVKSSGLIAQVLQHAPDTVILDEAHYIKNYKSANAKAAFALIKIPNRYVLTATPAHGKPEEIFSLLHFIKPKQYPSYWGFINNYFNTKQVYISTHSFKEITGFKFGKELELLSELKTFSTQRKRKDVMQWLPEKDYQKILLTPTPKQIKCLKELENFYETENIIVQGTLDRLIRYRQICLDPRLLDIKDKSPKVEWLKTFLEENTEKSIIIFSKFTSFLKLLQEDLQNNSVECIIGSTPVNKRAAIVQAFQNKKLKVLLINIDAGKEALTLDSADITIFTDKYPPYGDIAQAEDRFVATTEKKALKEHTVYELILKDTYDEELYNLVNIRATSTDVINNYKIYLKRRLSQ